MIEDFAHRSLVIDRALRAPLAPGLGGRLWAPEVGRTWQRWEEPPAIAPPLAAGITVTNLTSGASGSADPSTASISVSAGEVAWMGVMEYFGGDLATCPNPPTPTGWTLVTSTTMSNTDFPFRCSVLRRVGSFSGAQQITNADATAYTMWQVIKTAGCVSTGTNGANAQAQTPVTASSNMTAVNTITATFGSGVTAGNAVLAFSFDWSVSTLTQRAGFTQAYHVADGSMGTLMTAYRLTGETTAGSHTLTLGAETREAIIAIEVAAATSAAAILTADVGAFAETGQNAALTAGRRLTSAAGALALSAQVARLLRGYRMTAAAGSCALAGQDVAVRAARLVGAGSASFTEARQTAALTTARRLAAAAEANVVTGQVAGLLASRRIVADAADIALDGQDAVLAYTPAALHDYALMAGAGSCVLTGRSAALRPSSVVPMPDITAALARVGGMTAALAATGRLSSTLAQEGGLVGSLEEIV